MVVAYCRHKWTHLTIERNEYLNEPKVVTWCSKCGALRVEYGKQKTIYYPDTKPVKES